MTIATTSSTARQSVLKHVPELAFALAAVAVVLLALGPIGWRLGWWHFRFSLLTLMPWAAYVGLAAVIVSALALVIGVSRLDWRGIALALVALIGGGLIAYVPWHYDQLRQTLPPIHDITTDPDNPPSFVAVVPLRQGEGINSVAYEGAKIADQQWRAYPDILPLIVRRGKVAMEKGFGRQASDWRSHCSPSCSRRRHLPNTSAPLLKSRRISRMQSV
jgi:hypothetical protein